MADGFLRQKEEEITGLRRQLVAAQCEVARLKAILTGLQE